MCHLFSAGLPPQYLVELQFWDQLCIGTRIVPQPITPGFRCQVFRFHQIVTSNSSAANNVLRWVSPSPARPSGRPIQKGVESRRGTSRIAIPAARFRQPASMFKK